MTRRLLAGSAWTAKPGVSLLSPSDVAAGTLTCLLS